MIGPLPTALGGFNEYSYPSTSLSNGSKSNPSLVQRLTESSTFWMRLCIATVSLTESSLIWDPTSIITTSGNTARIAELTYDTFLSLTQGPTANSNVPMACYSKLLRKDYTTSVTSKEANGSRNYPMFFGYYTLNHTNLRGILLTSS